MEWFLLALVVMLFLGVPVAYAIAVTSLAWVMLNFPVDAWSVAVQQTVSGAEKFILLAVPLFMLAGELMNAGGVTKRLVNFAEALVGRVHGGLAQVVVVTNMIMAGVSGAAIADAAAVGSMTIPAMIRKGYPRGFSAAINAAAATIGPVIPPSVGFLIYASVVVVSPGQPSVTPEKLFLAGAVPGFLMGLYMIIACYILARTGGFPRGERVSLGRLWRATKQAALALLMPVVILGGILGGIVTPTEAGVLAVLVALFVGAGVYREIKIRDLPGIFAKTAKRSAAIMFIIACANLFGWVMSYNNMAQRITAVFTGITTSPYLFLIIISLVAILLGCFMEGGSIMIILTPLLCPVLEKYGVNLVQFGVIFQLTIMIGLLTPPVGILLFVITGVSGVEMQDILKSLWPFYLVLILTLAVLIFVPEVSLWLPRLRYGGG